jgi:ATP-dependent DNA ligase
MLARPGPLRSGSGWSFELKCDGFRAIVSTENGLRVRSRRGWNMTPVLPELRKLPAGLVLDGEQLVAWKGRVPWFPTPTERSRLALDRQIGVSYLRSESEVILEPAARAGDDDCAHPAPTLHPQRCNSVPR